MSHAPNPNSSAAKSSSDMLWDQSSGYLPEHQWRRNLLTSPQAPLSEVYGRRPVFLGTFSLYTLLIIPCALAPNVNSLLAVRFFGGALSTESRGSRSRSPLTLSHDTGVLAACSLTNSGGSIGDLWRPLERNTPFATFSMLEWRLCSGCAKV